MMPSTAIVWYRRDLRVHDHPALAAAAAEHDLVVPVFVTDPRFAEGRYASERRSGYMRSARRWRVGENLAWGAGGKSTPKAIVRAWMHSPPHRKAILTRSYRDVGLGVVSGIPQPT